MSRTVLVTGDRRWTDRRRIIEVLDRLHADDPFGLLIEGCGTGADWLAGAHEPNDETGSEPGWAWARKVPGAHYPADWERHALPPPRKNPAGAIRNRDMLMRLVLEPGNQLVVAFHNNLKWSRGTKDMVDIALAVDMPVWHVTSTTEGWLEPTQTAFRW